VAPNDSEVGEYTLPDLFFKNFDFEAHDFNLCLGMSIIPEVGPELSAFSCRAPT
jgi:hypothetical protein